MMVARGVSRQRRSPVDAPIAYRPGDASSRRVSGLCAVALGASYLAITVLYLIGGALPDDAAERLRHLADHTTTWRAILVLSVATDLLFVPVVWSLYTLLRDVSRNAMLAGTGLVGLFVVLDLALTWPNFSALITLGEEFVAGLRNLCRQSPSRRSWRGSTRVSPIPTKRPTASLRRLTASSRQRSALDRELRPL